MCVWYIHVHTIALSRPVACLVVSRWHAPRRAILTASRIIFCLFLFFVCLCGFGLSLWGYELVFEFRFFVFVFVIFFSVNSQHSVWMRVPVCNVTTLCFAASSLAHSRRSIAALAISRAISHGHFRRIAPQRTCELIQHIISNNLMKLRPANKNALSIAMAWAVVIFVYWV